MKKKNFMFYGLCMSACLGILSSCSNRFSVENKTVIVYSSNLKGDIDKLPQIAGVFDQIIDAGGDVILCDTGDFTSANEYVMFDNGKTYFSLLKDVGYSTLALGKNEISLGALNSSFSEESAQEVNASFSTNLKSAKLNILSSTITYNGECVYDKNYEIVTSAIKEIAFASVSAYDAVSSELFTHAVNEESVVELVNKAYANTNSDYFVCLSNEASLNDKFIENVITLKPLNDDGEFSLGAVAISKSGKISRKTFKDLSKFSNDAISIEVEALKTASKNAK